MIIGYSGTVSVIGCAAVGGKAELDGPLGDLLDHYDKTEKFGKNTWEEAEGEMQRTALARALGKCSLRDRDIGVLFAGDLMNQCTSSGYGLLEYDIPFAGLYGACSTAAEGMILASVIADSQKTRTAAVTSSHFCAAERQFRFPLEYGAQRTPTAQRTVTGAGAFILAPGEGKAMIKRAMLGRSVDSTITDLNNMGAAMAPAAVDTLTRFFDESGTVPADYDLILTGDLGNEGMKLTAEFMNERGYDIRSVYDDCGLLVYNRSRQDMHSGGSGCGCSAVVVATKIIPAIERGEYKNVLFIGTGALMSPTSVQQGLSIPSVAHLIQLCGNNAEVK